MTKEKLHGIDAENEPKFSAEEFTEEVFVLLEDYFVGNFQRNGNEVSCVFLNGQRFTMKIVSDEE